MRKLLLSLVVGTSAFAAQAQVAGWCAPGAEWVQVYSTSVSPSGPVLNGIVHARFVGDTLVGGLITQRILRDLYLQQGGSTIHSTLPTAYTRYGNGVVRIRMGQSLQFDTLLWLGAAPGDRWNLPGANDQGYEVEDTATVLVDGIPLRRLAVVLTNGGNIIGQDTIIGRIGLLHADSFDPQVPVIFGPSAWLQCYQDFAIAYSAPGVENCDFSVGIAPEPPNGAHLNVYPDPVDRILYVEGGGKQGEVMLEVLDASGRSCLSRQLAQMPASIAVGSFAPGAYTLMVRDGHSVFWSRFIKE
jgi:hypothetical protein